MMRVDGCPAVILSSQHLISPHPIRTWAAHVPPCVGMCQPLLPHPGTRLPHGRCSGNMCWVCVHVSPLSSPFPNSWKDGWPRKTWLCVGRVPLAPHLAVNLHHREPGVVGPDTVQSQQATHELWFPL